MKDTARPALADRLVRVLTRLPALSRSSSAARTIATHSTPRRLVNLLALECEYRMRRTRLRARPYILIVDPLNVCNLRCPLCPTGLLNQGRAAQLMTWETFIGIIDQMAPWAYKVNLFNWSEPLQHTHIFDMIRYARSKNLGTSLSTNFSLKLKDDAFDNLVTSGLEFLCLSIDGATQETYEHYRKRGDLSLVLDNVRRLLKRRAELGGRTPAIEWQFIPMRHNEHEIEEARRMAREMGVDFFRVIPVGIPFDSPDGDQLAADWYPRSRDGEVEPPQTTPCYYLYRYFVVNPDGRTAPCCIVYGEQNDFGDTRSHRCDEIWNNEKYRSARAQYRSGGKVTVPTVCDRCHLFEKRTVLPAIGAAESPQSKSIRTSV